MRYEWDETKRLANYLKHGVDFELAEAFDCSTAIETQDERFAYAEVRWVALGLIENRLYVFIYTFRHNAIRIISLRKANQREQKHYAKQT